MPGLVPSRGLIALALMAAAIHGVSAFAKASPETALVTEFVGGVSSSAVFDQPGFFDAARACFGQFPFAKFHDAAQHLQQDCLAKFMAKGGANGQAIAFMRIAPVPATITKVRNYGPVAVAHAAMMWADGADGWALIGKSGQFIPLWTPPEIDNSKPYAEVKARHPGISVWSDALNWPHASRAANGGENLRFDFTLKICHACAKLGIAEVIYQFDQGGRFAGVRLSRIVS